MKWRLLHNFCLAVGAALCCWLTGAHAAQGDTNHWAYQPIRRPAIPASASSNPIDAFIRKQLQKENLPPSATADRRTLIRRLSFVVLGLPPSPERVEQFANDRDPRGYEKLVDELLASPHFGERWARHWMDVVRYADTHGTEFDCWLPHAWRYRDYLIRAFNEDVPYNQFAREHVAGDLLEQARWNNQLDVNESLIATAWWRFVEFNQTPVDVKGEEVIVVDNQIDAFSKAFLGLTVSCARCHDHKFDPIPQRDFHGLYSILASTRTSMRVVDPPAKLHGKDAELAKLKNEIRSGLAVEWRKQVAAWPAALAVARSTNNSLKELSLEAREWRAALEGAAIGKSPIASLLKALASPTSGSVALEKSTTESSTDSFVTYADFSSGDDSGWFATGGFSQSALSGDFTIASSGPKALTAIYPAGRYSHLLSDKHPGTFRSPNFVITNKYISALVTGDNDARIRLIIENFQGDSLLFTKVTPKLTNSTSLRWVTLPIRDNWPGRRAYLEVIPRDDMPYPGIIKDTAKLPKDGRSGVGVRQIVFHDSGKPQELTVIPAGLFAGTGDTLDARLCETTGAAIDAWAANRCDDSQALWLNALLQSGLLGNDASSTATASLLAQYREIEQSIPVPTRIVGVADEAPGFDEALFPRGNHQLPGQAVPRHFLGIVAQEKNYRTAGSGRRELAEDLVASPLMARVMVNRLWHHVFGAGLVRTTDNFGKLGELPSHPELLDWLASEFAARGWSMKSMLRLMLTSETFRQSSDASAKALETDPDNRLLSHASLRRLDAESLRDSILSASGRLNRTMFGPSIPVPVPVAQRDDYTANDGPVDGRGRRSLYLEVRRNHPAPFLLAFDQPKPASPAGRRTPTNVPAQSLTLLNDPFMLQQAQLLAQRALEQPGDPMARIHWLYSVTLNRRATDVEIARTQEFITQQIAANDSNEAMAWRDLAHALFNLKEFLYLR